jgi:hypothetical protein
MDRIVKFRFGLALALIPWIMPATSAPNEHFHPQANKRYEQLLGIDSIGSVYSSYTDDSVTVVNRSASVVHLKTVHRSVARIPPQNRFEIACKHINTVFAEAYLLSGAEKDVLGESLLCGDLLVFTSEVGE